MIVITWLRFISDQNSNSSPGRDWNNSNNITVGTKTGKHVINRKHVKAQVHLSVVDTTTEKSSITAIKDKISSSTSSSMFSSSIKTKDGKRKRGRPTSANSLNRKQNIELPFRKMPRTKMSNSNLCSTMEEDNIHTENPFNITSSSSSLSSLEENDISGLGSRSESLEGEEGNSSTEKDNSFSEYPHNNKSSGNQSNQVTQGYFKKKTARRNSKSKHQTEHQEQVYTDNNLLVEMF